MVEGNNNSNSTDAQQPSTAVSSDVAPPSSPEPAAPEVVVAPNFDYVEFGEKPLGVIQIDYDIKTGKE
jgi:hypothetical protein